MLTDVGNLLRKSSDAYRAAWHRGTATQDRRTRPRPPRFEIGGPLSARRDGEKGLGDEAPVRDQGADEEFEEGQITTLGNIVHRGLNMIPEELRSEITQKIHEALEFAQGASMVRLVDNPGRDARP